MPSNQPDDSGGTAAAEEKPSGFLGRVFGGKTKSYKRAKLGLELQMYYNEELKAWVTPGEEESKRQELSAVSAPPPKTISAASLANSQAEDQGSAAIGGPPGAYGGGAKMQKSAGVGMRYAVAPVFGGSNGGTDSAAPSLLSGLKPPGSFKVGGTQPTAFKPTVFKPAVPENQPAAEQEEDDPVQPAVPPRPDAPEAMHDESTFTPSASLEQNTLRGARAPSPHEAVTTDGQQQEQQQQPLPPGTADDPVTLEVLSFWSFYRQNGYDAEAMAEWVDENYGAEYASVDYENMLQDPRVAASVQEHISANKRSPPSSPVAGVQGSRPPSPSALDSSFLANDAAAAFPRDYYGVGGGAEGVAAADRGVYQPVQEDEQQSHMTAPPAAEEQAAAAPGEGWNGFGESEFGLAASQEGGGGGGALPAEFGSGTYVDTNTYDIDATLDAAVEMQQQQRCDTQGMQYTEQYNEQYNEQYHAEYHSHAAVLEGASSPHHQHLVEEDTHQHQKDHQHQQQYEQQDHQQQVANEDATTAGSSGDPTLGQVLGGFFRPQMESFAQTLAGTGGSLENPGGVNITGSDLVSSMGGTLKGMFMGGQYSGQSQQQSGSGKLGGALPWDQQQDGVDNGYPTTAIDSGYINGSISYPLDNAYDAANGFVTPAAGPSPARPVASHHLPVPPSPPPPAAEHSIQSTADDAYPFSPGQLASDLGVPRAAVSVAELFTRGPGSVGTLSSGGSQDGGWSDGGDVIGAGDIGAIGGVPLTTGETEALMPDVSAPAVQPWEAAAAAAVEVEVMAPPSAVEETPVVEAPIPEQAAAAVVDEWGGWDESDIPLEAAHALQEQQHQESPAWDAVPPLPSAPAAETYMHMEQEQAPEPPAREPPAVVDTAALEAATAAAAAAQMDVLKVLARAVAAENVCEELQAEGEKLQMQAAQYKEAEEGLRIAQEEQAAVNATLAAEIAGLQESLSVFEQERSELENRCRAAETCAAEKATAAEEAESKLSALQAELDGLNAAMVSKEAAAAEAAAAAANVAVLQVEIEDVRASLEQSEAECDDLKSALELKDDAITALKARTEQLDTETAQLRGEVLASQKTLEETQFAMEQRVAAAVEEAIAAQRAQGEAERSALEEALRAELADKLAASESEMQGLQASIDDKDAEIMQLEARVMTTEAACTAAVNTQEESIATTAKVSAELKAAQSRIKELEKKFVLAKKKIQAQQGQHDQAVAEIETLKMQLKDAEARAAQGADSSTKDAELEEMSAALSAAQHTQHELIINIEALQARLSESEATRASELESLAADNATLAELLAEKEDHGERMGSEIAQLRSQIEILTIQASGTTASAQELATAQEELGQWMAVAEDADARCTAAEEALEAERAQREAAAAAAAHMQEEIALMQSALEATEAQLGEFEAMQEDATATAEQETVVMAQRLHAAEEEIASLRSARDAAYTAAAASAAQNPGTNPPPNTTTKYNNGGLSSRDVDDFEEEIEELRSQLAAASDAAAQKEEEMRRYKLQLVKAKKIRAADQEKIASLEALASSGGGNVFGAAGGETAAAAAPTPPPQPALEEEMAALRLQLNTVREELSAIKSAATDAEVGLEESLSALGQEEAKVARLAELLMENGMPEEAVEAELAAVEELLGFDEGEFQEEGLV